MQHFQIPSSRLFFPYSAKKTIKSEALDLDAMFHHLTSASDGGFYLASTDSDEPLRLESVWGSTDYANNLLVIQKDEGNNIYFGICLDGFPIFDCVVHFTELNSKGPSASLKYYIEQLSSARGGILIVSDGCSLLTDADNGQVATFYDDIVLNLQSADIRLIEYCDVEFDIIITPIPARRLQVSASAVKPFILLLGLLAVVFVSAIALISMLSATPPPPPPPKVIDNWKAFRNTLESNSVNVRMRMLAIYGDLQMINQVSGFELVRIDARPTSTQLEFRSSGGRGVNLKEFARNNGYDYSSNSDSYTLSATVPTVPIMKTAVRSIISAEETHLGDFLEAYYPDLTKVTFAKPVSQGLWVEKSVTIDFEKFTLHDIDTLGIMMSPHPFSFTSLVAEFDEDGFIKGKLQCVLYGVNGNEK